MVNKELKQDFQDACNELGGEYNHEDAEYGTGPGFENTCEVGDSVMRLTDDNLDLSNVAVSVTENQYGDKHTAVMREDNPEQLDIEVKNVRDERALKLEVRNANQSKVTLKRTE